MTERDESPFTLATQGMSAEERAAWFRSQLDKGGRPKKSKFSCNMKKALRQDWEKESK
jgi:hypothetical protein